MQTISPELKNKTFVPNEEQIEAALLVFKCMAFVETIKPVVKANQRQVLAENNYPYSEEMKGLNRKHRIKEPENPYIREPDDAWMMSADDLNHWHFKCVELHKEKGLTTEKPEQCPLLVAEHQLRQAKWHLCEVMEPVTGLSPNKITCNLKHYNQYIELNLKFLSQFIPKEKQTFKF